jgi:hypothetical protein
MAFQGYQGATVLAQQSLSNFGYFEGPIVSNKNEGTVKISLWATSESSTSYPDGDWKVVGEQYESLPIEVRPFSININSPNFYGASSFAIHVHSPEPPTAGWCYASVDPNDLTYYVHTVDILKEDENFGYLQWFAIDGGYSG